MQRAKDTFLVAKYKSANVMFQLLTVGKFIISSYAIQIDNPVLCVTCVKQLKPPVISVIQVLHKFLLHFRTCQVAVNLFTFAEVHL